MPRFAKNSSTRSCKAINELPDLREAIYSGIRDCAYHLEIFLEATGEYVMGESLLRTLSSQSVRGRLHREGINGRAHCWASQARV